MDKNIKACIINAGYGGWYPNGTDRLKNSLIHHGFSYDILTWKNEKINSHYDESQRYTIKAAAFQEAIALGYTRILWLDSSVWCIKSPDLIMDIINEEGGYFWPSGYDMAQCASDSDLAFAGWDRDYAETLPELSSSMLGINFENPKGRTFMEWFMEAKNAGVWGTSRYHNNGSDDPRYLHSRQDQTAASIAFHKAGFDKIYNPGVYSMYYQENNIPESVIFMMRGM